MNISNNRNKKLTRRVKFKICELQIKNWITASILIAVNQKIIQITWDIKNRYPLSETNKSIDKKHIYNFYTFEIKNSCSN